MKIILDIDDFSILRSRMDLLLMLKEHYPKLKVSLFTIPFDYEYELGQLKTMRGMAKKQIHENLDWMEFIPHGLIHSPREFENATKEVMEDYITNIEHEFQKDGLPMVRGFKAPQWLWNKDVVDVLDKHGWWGAADRNQPDMVRPKRTYVYDYSIDEPFWRHDSVDVLKLHGHMTMPSSNNLEDCMLNLMKMPNDAEFMFISEYMNEN